MCENKKKSRLLISYLNIKSKSANQPIEFTEKHSQAS